MSWVMLTAILIVLIFGFVVLFGAPYLPTLSKQQQTAFDLLNLKPGQVLLELGSGDGRMLIAAAKQGIKSHGYELNPILFAYSWLVTRRYHTLVSVSWSNFWRVKLPECDGIYVFLLDRFMTRLHNKITQETSNPVKLVSFAFRIPNVKHVSEKSGLFLYIYNNKN
jgi:hypothetical protein